MLRTTDWSKIERILKVDHSNHKIHTKILEKELKEIILQQKELFQTATNSLVVSRIFDLNNENETP